MVNNQPLSAGEEGRGGGGEAAGAMVVGVGCGGADGRVWSLPNDGEVSPYPSVGGGGEVVGVRWEVAGRCGGCGSGGGARRLVARRVVARRGGGCLAKGASWEGVSRKPLGGVMMGVDLSVLLLSVVLLNLSM